MNLGKQWHAPRTFGVALACFAATLLFLLFGPYSNFGRDDGYIDPWIYTGYFTNFSYLLRHYGFTYYVSRLPWIVPGVLAFKIASPYAATILLNTLIATSSALSLYWVVSWYFGRFPAVLAAIALVTNMNFFLTIGWDYPDGPAIAFAFVALACFVRPRGNPALNSILGGAFLALCGFTNMASCTIVLSMLLIPLWRHRHSRTDLVRQGQYVVTGVMAVTIPLCLIGKLLLNRYDFFSAQLEQALYAFRTPGYLSNMWGGNKLVWISGSFRLFLPLVLFGIGSVVAWLARKRSEIVFPIYLFAMVSFLLMLLQEFVFHAVALRAILHGSYIVVPMMALNGIVIGALWKEHGPGRNWSFQGRLAAGDGPALHIPTIGISTSVLLKGALILFAVSLPFLFDEKQNSFSPPMTWIVMALLGLFAMLFVIMTRDTKLYPVSCALVLLAVFVGPAWDGWLISPSKKDNSVIFAKLMDVQSVLKSGIAPEREARFWFDKNEPAGNFFDAAASLYLWRYFDWTRELPTASADTVRGYIHPNTTLVYLTSNPDKIAARDQMLASRHLLVANDNNRHWTVQVRGMPVHIVLRDVTDVTGVR